MNLKNDNKLHNVASHTHWQVFIFYFTIVQTIHFHTDVATLSIKIYIWNADLLMTLLQPTAVTDVALELLLHCYLIICLCLKQHLVSDAHDDIVSRNEEKTMCIDEISNYLYLYTLKKIKH